MSAVPSTRPEAALASVSAWVKEVPGGLTVAQSGKPYLVGRRGYYRDTMGEVGVNERGVYDDAVFVVYGKEVTSFNANTDPSKEAPGIATLVTGVWSYRLGTHNITKDPSKQYPALVQAAAVTVKRDGRQGLATGWFGVNMHRGGVHETTSAGCQTIYKPQWDEFLLLVTDLMEQCGLKHIAYVLTERKDAP